MADTHKRKLTRTDLTSNTSILAHESNRRKLQITETVLIRALLGLVQSLPCAGGGGGVANPPSISVTKRRGGKIQPAMEGPGRDLSDKV